MTTTTAFYLSRERTITGACCSGKPYDCIREVQVDVDKRESIRSEESELEESYSVQVMLRHERLSVVGLASKRGKIRWPPYIAGMRSYS